MAAEGPSAPPTIPALKTSFLNAQTNLLAQPLAPSRAWLAANDASDARIPPRELDFNLASLNQALAQHCRRVYAPQAARHVAEQINALYEADAERRLGGGGGGAEDALEGIGRELDLTEHAVVETLPPAWPSAKDADAFPAEAKRYADTVQRLADLSAQRTQLQRRVARLARLAAAVEPLKASPVDGAGVQENLATREGPVEKELERMRTLLTRVAGRVGRVSSAPRGSAAAGGGEVDVEVLTKARKRNVDEFLTGSGVFKA
ncbi:hypothetical protein S7711_04760 [Stachybotrys chartarum IBT 7711]|uniref:Kinetochore protein fta4 n=1 Tax=Stachybotrys chartarum (strain CBS 109288 / IBT 7711) TaxID=1280523 RepID=A0A084ASE7_STACB|nr:hypothetical protein S7711_04760 [Stachybotrys chartarum IBT 7711]KFA50029.1 hypothetical protein S40293_06820 [Stachybotrys chartarum IBT 40293]